MEIYINTKYDCTINNNHWLLPTIKELDLIIKNLNIMRKQVLITDIVKHNEKMTEIRFKNCYTNVSKKPILKRGFIYLIKSWKYYKIGKTINLQNRLRKYITENPNKIEIIHSFETLDYTAMEIKLHNMFKEKKHNREWFNLDRKDILYIKSL